MLLAAPGRFSATSRSEAVGFYERFGFVRLAPTTAALPVSAATPMFLPLNQIEDALG